MLTEGIKVIDYHQDSKTRFWINSGTKLATEMVNYHPDAYIPKNCWRELNNQEKRLITEITGEPDRSLHIGIVKLPKQILTLFTQAGVGFINSPQDCQRISQQPVYIQAMERLAEYILPLSLDDDSLVCRGIYLNPPGLATVTWDQQANKYIGLHFDSWDRLPIEERHLSSNRICLNLGKEDRYLLFINLSALAIWSLIQIKTINSLKNAFLQAYPDYPVIKVRIAPGEAYIAPTENIIHDGCSLDRYSCDLHLTIRGHLRLP
ncbi:MAG: hypothetical protein EA365_03675 [Gloeocapsa sp. DLM2.Bin57]|nr:MAG: hypothetical protein EA365_03675 [Gloeocapsa sp. DLM2.Bin57]